MESCSGLSLLANCSFEAPVVPDGSYTAFVPDQDMGGWKVFGAAGNVALVNTAYVQNGFTWPAVDGMQTLDLTGISNTATGVSQVVETDAGASYRLSFWLGNLVDPSGIFGTQSEVEVQIDDAKVLLTTNSDEASGATLAWKKVSLDFVATTSSTKIALLNGDGPTDNSNIVDDVLLIPLL